MGTTLNAAEQLGPPFRSIDEQVFFIPRHGRHLINNQLFKINFLREGSCLHAVDDEPPVRFDPGDVMIIPRVCRQWYLAATPRGSRRVHAIRLVLDPQRLPALAADHRLAPASAEGETDLTVFIRQHLQEVCHLPQGQDEHVRPLLAEARQEAEQRRPGYRHRVTAICCNLVVQLVRTLERLRQQGGPAAMARQRGRAYLVLQAQEYLIKNLGADLSLDQVAGHLGVSPEHLARSFKQETGQTVFTYLQHLRLEQAKTFLLGSGRSVTAIAALTGFSSVALFSRNFKRHVGRSPLAYRQERWQQASAPRPAPVSGERG